MIVLDMCIYNKIRVIPGTIALHHAFPAKFIVLDYDLADIPRNLGHG